jgi:hypothetical protein
VINRVKEIRSMNILNWQPLTEMLRAKNKSSNRERLKNEPIDLQSKINKQQ